MLAHFAKALSIDEIAELWSQETKEPASIIRRMLLKAFQPKLGSRFIKISGDAVISRDQLLEFCETAGITAPRFWDKAASTVISTSKAILECRKWIKERSEQGHVPENKGKLRDEAIERFSSLKLSKRGFDQAWDDVAPLEWRKPGRKPKRAR